MTPTTRVGVNDGHFTLILATSSYVNSKHVYEQEVWSNAIACYEKCSRFGIHIKKDPWNALVKTPIIMCWVLMWVSMNKAILQAPIIVREISIILIGIH